MSLGCPEIPDDLIRLQQDQNVKPSRKDVMPGALVGCHSGTSIASTS